MSSKYVDIPAIIQVIGGIYRNPQFIDNDEKYFFNEEDFPEEFHRILFGSIYNLYKLGAKVITPNTIEDYLESRPKQLAVYKVNEGAKYLNQLEQYTQLSAFDYYYSRMKKMTLLRMYDNAGIDLSGLYDINNISDLQKKQTQEDWLDHATLSDIADAVDKKIMDIRIKYADNDEITFETAGSGILELIDELERSPEFGVPLYGRYINTIFRGARLKKFYLRSAATGLGKSRSMIADACTIACTQRYDSEQREWIDLGQGFPTLFVSTEQEKDEIQTMMLAFLADVDEEHILTGTYYVGERDRVVQAGKILLDSPLYIELLSDFSLQDLENSIKKAVLENDVMYVFHDYIHTSMKILSEISSKSSVKNLREDNILFMISVKFKDLCNKYGIFIMSATQLNNDFKTAKIFDQSLLRGAKSIGDKIDTGQIMLETTEDDQVALATLIEENGFEMPDMKISVYKNRRGKYKGILLWCKANRGVCKIDPMFVTDYGYRLIPIEDTKILVQDNQK